MFRKNFLKRISAILLVFILALSLSATAFAAEDISVANMVDNIETQVSENFGGLMNNAIKQSERYDIADSSFLELSMLQPIDIIDVSEDAEVIATSHSVVHLPIVDDDGNIVLIFDIVTTENGVTCTLGTDFAPLLNTVKQDDGNTVVVLQDGYFIYAIADNGIYAQNGQNISLVDDQQKNVLTNLPVTVQTEATAYSLNNINRKYTQLATASLTVAKENEVVSPTETTVTGSKSLSDYPIVGQYVGDTQYGLCWAATVASIVRFEKKSTYGSLTAQNVADYMKIGYDDGGSNDDAKEALEHYLGNSYSPTIKSSVLSQADIKSVIDGTDPAYLQCRRPNGFLSYKYHAVALTGYNFTSTTTAVEIMDPAYECFKTCTYSSSSWTFAFGSYTYTWIKTIRIN